MSGKNQKNRGTILMRMFFGLFHTHLSVRSGLDFLNWCFDSLVEEWSYMKGFVAS